MQALTTAVEPGRKLRIAAKLANVVSSFRRFVASHRWHRFHFHEMVNGDGVHSVLVPLKQERTLLITLRQAQWCARRFAILRGQALQRRAPSILRLFKHQL